MSEFRFIPEAQEYFLGNKKLPSVTDILRAEGFYKYNYIYSNSFYKRRARDVSEATVLYDKGELSVETADRVIASYLKTYARFKEKTKVKILDIKVPKYHPRYLYAGVIDRICMINGEHALINIKAGSPQKADPVELVAYGELLREETGKEYRLFNLYLDKGTYRLVERKDTKKDLIIFLSALQCYKWKKENL